MSDLPLPPEATPASPPPLPLPSPAPAPRPARAPYLAILLLALLVLVALALAWLGQQRIQALEQELVKRQQTSAEQASEARVIAKQAQEWSQDAVAKVTLVESRMAEFTAQRGQLEELIQSLSRSRDENLVVDIEAGLRVALQQTSITGSAEPLVAALKAADERLARFDPPRLEVVRRAITRDIERIKSVGVADLGALALRLDEAVRLADEAPLLVMDSARAATPPLRPAPRAASAVAVPASAASASAAASAAADAAAPPGWAATAAAWWAGVWGEARGLLRVARVDQPEAMLLAPEQGFFLRENLKLRLLNARLALLSRQFDVAQGDLRDALQATERYYDATARKTVALTELLNGVAAQSRQASVPRPDETLTALAAAAASR